MVRNRKKKSVRKLIDAATMEACVRRVVDDDWSVRSAAAALGINRMTLQRYVTKFEKLPADAQQGMNYTPNFQTRTVFSEAIELQLKNYLFIASNMHHGLTRKQVMSLAYELAVANNINCPGSWHHKNSAGVDWFSNFMRRYPDLSLRKPEGTSLARWSSFNKNTVTLFDDNLEATYKQLGNDLSPAFIYNLDKTALTTVHNPPNVIAQKGKKQVGQVTSGERGTLVTACCFIAANGNSIPPFLVFPRKNVKLHMLHGAPTGSEGAANPSGWMNGEVFIDVLKHFQKHVRASVDHKVLLIFDNHDSHITMNSLNFCEDNGIILLTLPPHTSNKLQPLDRKVYKSLKHSFNTACNDWMLSNPGKTISIYQIVELFGIAYPTAFTVRNVTKGFESTGIWPFNRNLFGDDEYLCSYVTDRPAPTNELNEALSVECNNNNSSCQVDKNSGISLISNSNLTYPRTSSDFNNQLALDAVVVPASDFAHHNVLKPPNTSLVSDILTALENSNESIVLDIPVINANAELPVITSESTDDSLEVEFQAMTNLKPECKKAIILPQDIKPFPKAAARKGTNQKRKISAILTDSPVKDAICNEIKSRNMTKELIKKRSYPTEQGQRKCAKELKFNDTPVTEIPSQNSKVTKGKPSKDEKSKVVKKRGRPKKQKDSENKDTSL